MLSPAHRGFSGVPETALTKTCSLSKSRRAYGRYFDEIRPWFVGTLLNPPPEVCGLALLAYDPATLPACCDDPGRTDPATPKPFPCERELDVCVLKTVLYWSGREKLDPSCNVTIKIPGRG